MLFSLKPQNSSLLFCASTIIDELVDCRAVWQEIEGKTEYTISEYAVQVIHMSWRLHFYSMLYNAEERRKSDTKLGGKIDIFFCKCDRILFNNNKNKRLWKNVLKFIS